MEIIFFTCAIIVALAILNKYGNRKSKNIETIKSPKEENQDHCNESFNTDHWEGSFWEAQDPLPAKSKLKFIYTDGSGKETNRTIDTEKYGRYGSTTLIIGYCHLRKAKRTFRADRIKSCINLESNETITDVESFLQKKYDESPNKSKDTLFTEHYDMLRALLYVGKADGQLRADEVEVIREQCVSISGDERLNEKDIKELLSSMDVPTIQAFKLAIGRLAKLEKQSKVNILNAAKTIVATQKTVHPSEEEALNYIEKRFFIQ